MGINFVTDDSSDVIAVPMFEVFEEFRQRHDGWLLHHITEDQWRQYFESIVENMVAHMEYENIGIPSYAEYVSQHVVEGINLNYTYHPHRFIRFINQDAKGQYLRLLCGFASHFFSVLQEMNFYDDMGRLKWAYQGVDMNTLYLARRKDIAVAVY